MKGRLDGRPSIYFFFPAFDTGGVMPAVASTLGFSFLGFLASLLDFSWPLAMVFSPMFAAGPNARQITQ